MRIIVQQVQMRLLVLIAQLKLYHESYLLFYTDPNTHITCISTLKHRHNYQYNCSFRWVA